MIYEIQLGQVNTEPALLLGRETAQLPSLTPWVTTIPVQCKTTYIPNSIMPNVQFKRQQANGNHMSAQHYAIEYREGDKCVYPLVALSILYVTEKKQEIKSLQVLKFQG